jgi:hypothetical protein
MLFREMTPVYSEDYTKQTQNSGLLILKQVVHVVTTALRRLFFLKMGWV